MVLVVREASNTEVFNTLNKFNEPWVVNQVSNKLRG